jgi:hypothetical protein
MSLKRRFSTKPPHKKKSDWVFFTDRDLGRTLPNALRAAGYIVQIHDDVFRDPRTKDEVWLPKVAEQGWIALSHNKKQRRVRLERDANMRAGGALFHLIGRQHDEIVRNLIVTVPKIIRFRESYEPPFMARVTRPEAQYAVGSRPGNVKMALTKAQWLEV